MSNNPRKKPANYLGTIINPNTGKELGQVLVNNKRTSKNILNHDTVMGHMTLVKGDLRFLRRAWFHSTHLLMNIANKQVPIRIAGMPKKIGENGILEIFRPL